MAARAATLALLAALTACGEAGSSVPANNAAAGGPTSTWPAGDCTLPSSPTGLIGRTADALLASYGRPATDSRFLLGTGVTPPRTVLLNRLPLAGNERVTVREISWVRSGCSLTAWLVQRGGRWSTVQTLRASAAAEY